MDDDEWSLERGDWLTPNQKHAVWSKHLGHKLLIPFLPQKKSLMPHCPSNYQELFYCSYRGHIAVLYPASVIDRMPGGFSGLMRSLELVQRIAATDVKGLSYLMPVHFQHSSLGFEVVLRGKIGSTHHFDQPMHTKLYKKYPTIRSVFVNEPSKFINSVFGFAAKLLQTGVLVTDISRPCLWVRAADSSSHYFLGLHTFVELKDYPSMAKASLAWAVNDLELGASQERIWKHFQAVTSMVGVAVFKDVAVLSIPAVVDTSVS